MRAPVFLLVGLLAVTVPSQPSQAVCVSIDLQYRSSAGACNDVADDALRPYLGVVVDLVIATCDGSLGQCDDAVVGIILGTCGGSVPPCQAMIVGLVGTGVDFVLSTCGGSVPQCQATAIGLVDTGAGIIFGTCGGSTSQCQDTVVGLIAGACGGSVSQCDDAVGDFDGDSVPDALEGEVCGRAALRDAIAGNAPYLGTCATTTDYAPPSSGVYTGLVLGVVGQAIGVAGGIVNGAVGTAVGAVGLVQDSAGDRDHDGVPDDREPLICSVENQNSALDGSCAGNDYTRPL